MNEGNYMSVTQNDETYTQKVFLVLHQAVPGILCFFAEKLQPMINIVFIGHFSGSINSA